MIELTGKLGKYNILRKLGSGGFGTVYLAEDTFLKTDKSSVLRALKIPHRVGPNLEKLKQESILQTKLLDHPNIVKLLTVDKIDGNIVMIMEYVQGRDLEELIDEQNKIELKTALKYFKQILSAVSFAHKHRILHRDIRPSNIMIDNSDNIKMADFGTSKLLGDKLFATTRIGSPPYMAPEHFEGKAVFASDVYSCGCLFYEMVTGLPPIVTANPMDIYKRAKAGEMIPLIRKVPKMKKELSWIIMKTLSPNIEDRYAHAELVLDDILKLENVHPDKKSEIKNIKERISARTGRVDTTCWHCKKSIPGMDSNCPYCGTSL